MSETENSDRLLEPVLCRELANGDTMLFIDGRDGAFIVTTDAADLRR